MAAVAAPPTQPEQIRPGARAREMVVLGSGIAAQALELLAAPPVLRLLAVMRRACRVEVEVMVFFRQSMAHLHITELVLEAWRATELLELPALVAFQEF